MSRSVRSHIHHTQLWSYGVLQGSKGGILPEIIPIGLYPTREYSRRVCHTKGCIVQNEHIRWHYWHFKAQIPHVIAVGLVFIRQLDIETGWMSTRKDYIISLALHSKKSRHQDIPTNPPTWRPTDIATPKGWVVTLRCHGFSTRILSYQGDDTKLFRGTKVFITFDGLSAHYSHCLRVSLMNETNSTRSERWSVCRKILLHFTTFGCVEQSKKWLALPLCLIAMLRRDATPPVVPRSNFGHGEAFELTRRHTLQADLVEST